MTGPAVWRGVASRRRLLGGAGLTLAGAALAACGGPTPGEAPAANKAPVTLSFMSWRPIAMDQFAPIWTEYGKKNYVTFDVDKSEDGTLTKLTTMFAADAGMDLFDASTGVMPRIYDAGFVLQLDRLMSRDKFSFDKDFAILGIERWRQKTFGVPYWSPHDVENPGASRSVPPKLPQKRPQQRRQLGRSHGGCGCGSALHAGRRADRLPALACQLASPNPARSRGRLAPRAS